MSAIARLRSLVARRPAVERCGLCGEVLAEGHPHLVEAGRGKPLCACLGCATVFSHGGGKYRRVPERVAALRVDEERRAALGVPVGIAFFRAGRAVYPSPLGAVESSVPEGAWEALLAATPELRSMDPEVEALLLRPGEAFLVPIDAAYRLIGLLRREWRGFTGGDAVQGAVDAFFEDLRGRSGGTSR